MKARRKSLFYLLMIFMAVLFISFSSHDVYADDIYNGGGSGTDGAVDPNASATGVSKNRSGYLVYLANDSGAVTSPVVLVHCQ